MCVAHKQFRPGRMLMLMLIVIGCSMTAEARGDVPSPPQFRNHVVPLLTKLGCNQAACHGAAEGQAGFHLSLFGYDLESDHQALLAGDPDPRSNWRDPEASLLLRKPSGLEDHDGGVLFDPQSFEYQVLLEWVKNRARGIPLGSDWLEVVRLEVKPAVLLARPDDKPPRLRVKAHWNNNTHEDVTRFCRFECKDTAVASVDANGQVTLNRPGMTHVVIYYDRMIQPVEVIVPFPETAHTPRPSPSGTGVVDDAVNRQLSLLNLQPAGICSDAEFLRRVSLDVTGRLPHPDDVIAFINDAAPDKRERKIDELLASDAYADFWAAWMCELFGLNEAVMPDSIFREEEALLSYHWIRRRIVEDVSYERIVSDTVRSLSRPEGQSFADYTKAMNANLRAADPADFARQEQLPFFWGRKHIRDASNKALTFSHTFLAVKLQCAECHKHPFDRWTKEDFEGLEAFFEPMKFGTPAGDKDESTQLRDAIRTPQGKINDHVIRDAFEAGKIVPFPEVYFDDNAAQQVDRLQVLSEWMQNRNHPYLAIALVNRVWAHYFGTGIVSTLDDLSVGHPPSNRQLLDQLVLGFIESGYRLRWLHRQIATSHAYHRSAAHEDAVPEHGRQFAQAQFRPLPAEVLFDAVLSATVEDPAQVPPETRMVGLQSVMRQSNRSRALMERMGQPEGKEVCVRARSNEPTLPRTLELYNGPAVRELINHPDGWISGLRKAAKNAGREQSPQSQGHLPDLITAAYLRTVSRMPTEEELNRCQSYCQESANTADGIRDVLWALINSREFLLNH
mgnify:CR=1 FL=1